MSEAVACRFCGYTVLRGKKYCPHCGMEILDTFATIEEYEREKRKLSTFIALLEKKYVTKGIPYSQYKIKKEEYSLRLADIEERITEAKVQERRETPKQRIEDMQEQIIEIPAEFNEKAPSTVETTVQQRISGRIAEFLLILETLYSEYSEYASEGMNKEDSTKMRLIGSELSKFADKIDHYKMLFSKLGKKI
jgi:hypothetical protein